MNALSDPSMFDAAPRFEQLPILGDQSFCYVHCMQQNSQGEEGREQQDWAEYCANLCQSYASDPAVQTGWKGATQAALNWPTSPALVSALNDPYLNFSPAALGGSSVWGGRFRAGGGGRGHGRSCGRR